MTLKDCDWTYFCLLHVDWGHFYSRLTCSCKVLASLCSSKNCKCWLLCVFTQWGLLFCDFPVKESREKRDIFKSCSYGGVAVQLLFISPYLQLSPLNKSKEHLRLLGAANLYFFLLMCKQRQRHEALLVWDIDSKRKMNNVNTITNPLC